MNATVQSLATVPAQASNRALTANDIRHRVNVIQEVMHAVMKKDVHYGIIPGCDKPTLYKPGSEVLLATFQIAPSIFVEDLSTDDCIRYRVRVLGTHSPSGMVLGEGIGECSSNEVKYKWRKAYDDEFNATPENRRRITFGKYKNKQVRTEPADLANTILKMAKKRAQVDMTLTVTGASDCFDQDIEDLPAEYLQGQRAAESSGPAELPTLTDEVFAKRLPGWLAAIDSGKKTADEMLAWIQTKAKLSPEQAAEVRKPAPKAEPNPNFPLPGDPGYDDSDDQENAE